REPLEVGVGRPRQMRRAQEPPPADPKPRSGGVVAVVAEVLDAFEGEDAAGHGRLDRAKPCGARGGNGDMLRFPRNRCGAPPWGSKGWARGVGDTHLRSMSPSTTGTAARRRL